ncbi:hypothetical protein NIES970_24630 [[Synechococcus] sp. NIES-970]|uniref:DUF2854 domain-containing protein n=1 Tax=Picosynechococcus sp. NKBG15041c TaxID=1407650 RepID=UPI000412EDAE|nr:DUF2854 domain-containing protein [Picosynechococcus sp. NKBG15041c]BAW97511.1 hypothetical protein NIES970_24630 [[Synechococcus] sp. NIES-970]
MFGKISLGSVGLVIGGILSVIGFAAYGFGNATLNLAGMFYGIPILLGGLALKAAEIKPTPYSEALSQEIEDLRATQATATQQQIRKDVTRYRYGQDCHLDDALERLGLSPTDEERPLLHHIREEAREGRYALVLEFKSPLFSLEDWQTRQEKIERFFGPDITAAIAQPTEDEIEVALIRAA